MPLQEDDTTSPLADIMDRIRISKTNARRAGDPLNLRPENKRAALAEAKAERKAAKRAKVTLAPGPRTAGERGLHNADIVDEGLTRQAVKARGYSLAGYTASQLRGADRFTRDWNIAREGALKAASHDMKIDGGGGHASRTHLARVEAQERLRSLRSAIGDRQYMLLRCVLIEGISPTRLHAMGGPEHRTITFELGSALHGAAGFYSAKAARPDALMRAMLKIVDAAQS